jgi:hypothetical protein
MSRVELASSHLAAATYDPQRRVLEVEFRNGAVYRYLHISPALYKALIYAPSHGAFFDAFIKKGGYPFRRVR